MMDQAQQKKEGTKKYKKEEKKKRKLKEKKKRKKSVKNLNALTCLDMAVAD